MKTKILWLGLILCYTAQLSAMDRPSLYDPLGVLSVEEKNRIDAEGRTIISNRKVNGQNLLIQIDFLSKDEFGKKSATGRDDSGRTLFSLETYSSWSMKYFAQPAVLMLFIDQGNDNYVLDALNFSDILMDEGIPDLVRRYIRDEIMKKETSYVETISSGLYAIGEALNPVYKERLISEHIPLFNNNQYKRRHAWPVAIPMNYYSFEPRHDVTDNNDMFPDNLHFVGNDIYLDWSEITYNETETIDITREYSKETEPWYDQYLLKKIEIPVLRNIIDNPATHEDNEKLITDTFKQDLIEILNEPIHYGNKDLSTHTSSMLPLAFNGMHAGKVSHEHRIDRFGCRIKVSKQVMDQPWQYIPDVINRAIYPGWGERGPTWCNQYARDLSGKIFDKPIFESFSANDLYDYMSSSKSFIEINNLDAINFVNTGFIVFLIWKNPTGKSGHVETLLPNNIQTIDSYGNSINTNENEYSVGAGGIMYSKTNYTENLDFKRFLFLGHLKTKEI